MTMTTSSACVKPSKTLALNAEPKAYPPRVVAGFIRRAQFVALAVRINWHTGDGTCISLQDVSKAVALRFVRQQYGRGTRIDAYDVFGTLVIG
jgi:hypothetical protein